MFQAKGCIQFVHRNIFAQGPQAGHAVLLYAARHNAAVMGQVGREINADTVKADPFFKPHSNGSDLFLAAVCVCHPDPDPSAPPLGN